MTVTDITLGGKYRPHKSVTPTKVTAVKNLMEGYLRGDFLARATLQEALTTSDAIFNFAQLANINFLPQFERAERTWTQVAGERTVNDFRPATLYSIVNNYDGNVISPQGAAPVIPEGTPYPFAYFSGQESTGTGVQKKGFKTDWTLESRINDGLGVIDAIPGEMLRVALDTEEAAVYTPLIAALGANNALAGGVVFTGETVPANSALSRNALIRALFEVSQRKINGRNIVVTGGWNLLVPVGIGPAARFLLGQTLTQVQTGTNPQFTLSIDQNDPLAGITVVETQYITGAAWALVPKPGASVRPVVEHLVLRGYTAPELRVENVAGNYAGGGAVSPFEGSFENDSITMRLRILDGGVVWDNGLQIVSSTGSGTA